jgi:hypothetical protein
MLIKNGARNGKAETLIRVEGYLRNSHTQRIDNDPRKRI